MIPTPSTEWSIVTVSERRYTVTVVWRYQRKDKTNQTEKQARWWEKEWEHDESIVQVHIKEEK